MVHLESEERDAILFHGAFAVLCAAALLLAPVPAIGVKLCILVILYTVALPVTARVRGYGAWIDIWLFAAILSAFQVFPDWFLSRQLGVLVFPEDGFPKIGTVSGYMAGLWTIPVFIIVYTARRVAARRTTRAGYAAAAAIAFVIFGVSEATVWMLPAWHARGVTMIGHVALYIIPPEIILGMACLYAYERTEGRVGWMKVPAAFLVMLLYLGSAAFFFFVMERLSG